MGIDNQDDKGTATDYGTENSEDRIQRSEVQATYTYGNDLISAKIGEIRGYYHYDGLGTVKQLTDNSGAVVANYTYDSFGNLIASTGTSNNTHGFTGEQQFSEADSLVFLRARYYDSRVGRFISRDPRLSIEYYIRDGRDLKELAELKMKPLKWNLYIYCLNNPVNLIDPTGGCEDAVSHAIDIAEIVRDSKDVGDCAVRCTDKFVNDEIGCGGDGVANNTAYRACLGACEEAFAGPITRK